ncbi:MAG TPA: response regulator transcription factor [Verrucomicrobiae bacterium]|nr:response regulator transcription factor [Verrucomicrobiae bacterium]
MRILVVEDSVRLQRALTTGLRRAGYAVDAAAEGEEGLWMAQSNDYDVVVLDLMLPRLDGLSLLRKLRAREDGPNVLILTVKDTVEDRVAGLRAGADDYLTKPFAFAELLARVESLVRRKHHRKNPVVRVGQLELDTCARTVKISGQPVVLTPREYRLLELLALRPGEVISRTEIEEHIYDDDADLCSNVVDSAMSILRKKLQSAGNESLIQTRRGMGYVLGGSAV